MTTGKAKEAAAAAAADTEPAAAPEPVVVPSETVFMQIVEFLLDSKATPVKRTVLSKPHGRRSHRSWGDMTPTFRGKGDRGHNLGIILISHFALITATLMSTPYFVPPLAKKWGVKNFLLASVAEFVPPHFQNRGAAPGKPSSLVGLLF